MTNKTKMSYSFASGIQKIALKDQKCVKREICEALSITNRHEFCRKKHGIVNISKLHYDAVTAIFARYGIAENEVWDIVNA